MQQPSSRQSGRPTAAPTSTEDQINIIIEEKIVKTSGETIVKKYLKGKFLGKVRVQYVKQIGRLCKML
jgi:ERCC4-related helicase